jgi:Ca2+-binding EF-hand superfamily protein
MVDLISSKRNGKVESKDLAVIMDNKLYTKEEEREASNAFRVIGGGDHDKTGHVHVDTITHAMSSQAHKLNDEQQKTFARHVKEFQSAIGCDDVAELDYKQFTKWMMTMPRDEEE